jgi:hypothetical protein
MAGRALTLHYFGDPAGDLSLKLTLPAKTVQSAQCRKLATMFHKKFLAKHAGWPVKAGELWLEHRKAVVGLERVIADAFPGDAPLEVVVKSPATAAPAAPERAPKAPAPAPAAPAAPAPKARPPPAPKREKRAGDRARAACDAFATLELVDGGAGGGIPGERDARLWYLRAGALSPRSTAWAKREADEVVAVVEAALKEHKIKDRRERLVELFLSYRGPESFFSSPSLVVRVDSFTGVHLDARSRGWS